MQGDRLEGDAFDAVVDRAELLDEDGEIQDWIAWDDIEVVRFE